ncbi:MAG: hypothetical protein QM760_17850 [Nibricoccus sp.]
MFKRESIDTLVRKLRNSFFTEHAFQLSEGVDGAYVKIVFRPHPDFFFEVRPHHKDDSYVVIWAPGESLVTAERTTAQSVYGIGSKIEQWIEFLKAEVTPQESGDTDIDMLRKTFFKSLSEIVADKNEPFSADERDVLHSRLSTLEQKLSGLLEKQEASERKLEELRKLFDGLETASKTQSKSTWLYSMGGRLLNYLITLAKTEQGKQLVHESVKKLIKG